MHANTTKNGMTRIAHDLLVEERQKLNKARLTLESPQTGMVSCSPMTSPLQEKRSKTFVTTLYSTNLEENIIFTLFTKVKELPKEFSSFLCAISTVVYAFPPLPKALDPI